VEAMAVVLLWLSVVVVVMVVVPVVLDDATWLENRGLKLTIDKICCYSNWAPRHTA
jgi:hypothetical protein